MSYSIPNQALRGRDPNCGICGHRKTQYGTAHFCTRCDFNLPYDEEPHERRDTDS